MLQNKNYHLDTQALHEGYSPDETNSRAVPLHRSAAFQFKSTEHAANLFALKELGNIYTRLTNPTCSILEQRVTALEGGAAAVSFASGTAAIYNSIINIAQAGDNIISANKIYGGTYTMFDSILPNIGITVKIIDFVNLDNIKSAIDDNTKAIFIETIGNPTLQVLNIEEISKIAHDNGIPLVVDATFTTPVITQSIKHGADIVINSLTKWYGGHGNAIGGIVVDAGNFKWANNPRFPLFNEPDTSYHGVRWAHDIGPLIPIAFAIRQRVIPLRNIGACLSPDNAWIFLQGIETLPLRMKKHSNNALKVAEFLSNHPKVEWVNYPGLSTDTEYATAKKYFKNGFGGVVVFNLKDGRPAGEKFINSLSLFSHLANVGDTRSLAIHPASTTHSQLSKEQQEAAGISAGLVRLAVGIEHIDDIIADLEQALK